MDKEKILEELSFEERIEKTKQILSKLNNQSLNLRDGLNLYKDGLKELELAQKMLENVKLQYQELKVQNMENKEQE
ncbi:exodeoxyribonuclease VII small subunit [Helicobacter cappadocius]|uniref:Exodeoxyribonuclease VII small subunit n=1 Tax=Helicobacter cappadocius TaxID=3063998 RepID=A0AA90T4V8_9HELI|nr:MULTISPECIES: exodeoxyribonuclease VII small subunit [unclassified Helicobacter]MDO7253096.1 exodeoxyribonuclease VII small subunit [Helicobacter sp. faydin-H75]MDP2538778.1 exodeoxyribonuclease VII small subunit [Helicobacter sp. faydin-H76]